MSSLEEDFYDAIMDTIYAKATDMIAGKLAEQGVLISKKQRKIVDSALRGGKLEQLEVKGPRTGGRATYSVVMTAQDAASLQVFAEGVIEKMPDIMTAVVREVAPATVLAIRAEYRKDLRKEVRAVRQFEKRLNKRWARPLAELDIVVELAERLGEATWFRHAEANKTENAASVSAMVTLHSRAIRAAREIGVLLRAGYPEGALARWRTLHELVVTAAFIHGKGEECAERYLDHSCVDACRSLLQSEKVAEQYEGHRPPEDTVAAWKEEYERALARYGDNFASDYGWAQPYLDAKKVTFRLLEDAVDLASLRPPYRLASGHVHANRQAPWSDFSNPTNVGPLSGPSNFGLAQPGEMTAKSLALVTMTVIMLQPTLDTLVGGYALAELALETGRRFDECEEALIHDDPALRNRFGVDSNVT
ncbi:MAG: DUF5677 domain-containing protein [Gemmatimonadales bacterium]|nr:DUF5677 domain-containing protein [Gemmatimonadales bacterium]